MEYDEILFNLIGRIACEHKRCLSIHQSRDEAAEVGIDVWHVAVGREDFYNNSIAQIDSVASMRNESFCFFGGSCAFECLCIRTFFVLHAGFDGETNTKACGHIDKSADVIEIGMRR